MKRAAYRDYLEGVNPRFRSRIMIHSHHDLIHDLTLKGVHYTEKTKPLELTPHPTGCLQSAAFHSLHQLREAPSRFSHGLDYALLSPVFDSISKKDYQSAQFDRNELRSVLQAVTFSVYALGGVEVTKLEELKALGFTGVAVLGAIWESPDPLSSFRAIQEKCTSDS